ncbi:MAG: signal peptidase I [Candidatus Aminicenantes bacterium]|nr:signal peptidase I [Candidatus Aminicenantes bacterium]
MSKSKLRNRQGQPGKEGGVRENLKMLLEVMVTVLFVNGFLLQSFVIPTASMENHMLVGDHLLVDKVAYSQPVSPVDALLLPQRKIERGMIVVFKAPPAIAARDWSHLTYVKRVIGLPGETVQIIGNIVYIDGKQLFDPHKTLMGRPSVPADFPPGDGVAWWPEFPREYRDQIVQTENGPAFRVPAGHYFCLGDNRFISADSRIWGPLPADHIIGKPWRNYWSFDKTKDGNPDAGIIGWLKDVPRRFIARTRWDRILKKF